MNRKLDIKKGDKVVFAIEERSNASRRVGIMTLDNIDKWTYKGEVISAGKKYISVKYEDRFNNADTIKFVIDDDYRENWTHGGANYKLYKNIEEVIEEYKSKGLYSRIRSIFSNWNIPNNITLDKMERIIEILEED